MKKIGNIVTKSKKNTFGDIFNVVKSFDDIIKDIPTLIIGFEEAKEYIEDFNIIDKQYGDVWWTFKKTERRCEYEDDVIKFYNYAILHEMEKTKYVYVDLINFSLNSIKKMIKNMYSLPETAILCSCIVNNTTPCSEYHWNCVNIWELTNKKFSNY